MIGKSEQRALGVVVIAAALLHHAEQPASRGLAPSTSLGAATQRLQ